jgi:phosphoglycolate phosphatase
MHLIFDLDGTLFETAHTVMTAVRALFDELGLPVPDEAGVLTHIGKPSPRFLAAILPEGLATEAVAARFCVLERAAVSESGRVFFGVPDMLQSLRCDGHKMSVCSNGSEEYIRLVLAVTGIEAFFAGIYSAKFSSSKAEKVREMLTSDEDAVVIGDAGDDLAAASQNALPSIAAMYGYGAADPVDATLTAQSPSDITSCVRRLRVFADIKRRLFHDDKRVIGISGIDTSGKTEFTDAFAHYLRSVGQKCLVIHMDDFHNPVALRRQGDNDIDAYYQNAFNYRQLIDEVLQPLRKDGFINKDVLCLNLDTDTYETVRHFEADGETVILMEGVLLFRPPVMDYLDGTVFLQISFDEMLRRARVRDVPKYGEAFLQKYIDKYIPVQKRYLEEYRPHERCDVFIDNGDYRNPKIFAEELK